MQKALRFHVMYLFGSERLLLYRARLFSKQVYGVIENSAARNFAAVLSFSEATSQE